MSGGALDGAPKIIRGVYFIEGGGLVKIGVSLGVRKRLTDLQAESPVPLTLLGWEPDATVTYERWLHARYAAFRHHGEWFTPTQELLDLATGKRPDIARHSTIEEAAETSHIDRYTIRQLISAGKLTVMSKTNRPNKPLVLGCELTRVIEAESSC